MVELSSTTSIGEFEATLLKARSIPDSDNPDHSDVESSQSNPYLQNGDILTRIPHFTRPVKIPIHQHLLGGTRQEKQDSQELVKANL
ncbi:hypothetical protein CR513_22422, partial [Mucuna pruriens]